MKFNALKSAVCRALIAVALWRGVTLSAAQILIQPVPVKLPTLQAALWSSFVTATNGHTSPTEFTNLWQAGGVTNITWDTNSPLYGKSGFTAFSLESNFGLFGGSQWGVPCTALTRRHVYIRGHSNGATNNTLDTASFSSQPIHFLTSSNTLVLRYARAAFKRTYPPNNMDECLILLDSDLPDSIQPVTMVDPVALGVKLAKNTLGFWPGFNPLLATCQHNQIGTLDGHSYNAHNFYVGGDSGGPDFYILNGAVVMLEGRTTTGWCPLMQADCDALTTWAGLDPANYQIQLLDLTQFSDF